MLYNDFMPIVWSYILQETFNNKINKLYTLTKRLYVTMKIRIFILTKNTAAITNQKQWNLSIKFSFKNGFIFIKYIRIFYKI